MTSQPLSIAIVGSGIAGLFCAHRLAQRGHRVTIFEQLPRIGGRIETLNLEGLECECGPMRFELAIQPMLKQLADDLGIQFSPFAPPRGEPVHTTKYTLEDDEMSSEQRRQLTTGGPDLNFSQHTTSLDLLRLGIYRILHCPDARPQHDADASPADKVRTGSVPWTFEDVIERRPNGGPSEIERYADTLEDDDYDRIRTRVTLGGRTLYTMGLWNALDYVLSAGAVAKIRDVGTFYHLIPENPSASEWSIFWLRLFRSAKDLSTIQGDGGVSQIVARLERQLRKMPQRNVEIATEASVVEMCAAPRADQVRLTVDFRDRANVLALDFDHVILALPKHPVSKLTRHFPPEIRRYLDGVNGFPLLKVFAILKEPWWTARGGALPGAQHGAHLVPTREVHYRERVEAATGTRAQRTVGMVLLYTDRPANAYWTPYIQAPHEGAQVNTPASLKRELAAQLLALETERETGPQESYKTQIDTMEASIAAFAIRDWSKPPFGAASHAWQPGINVPDAIDRLKAFSLVGQPGRDNVHVCGEAYSDYQGFIEGSLRSAAKTIASIPD
jgi:phytoene dehydrogenase-like protein